MTPGQTAQLLTLMRGFDPRSVPADELDLQARIAAWTAALNRYPLERVQAVVIDHYQRPGAPTIDLGTITAALARPITYGEQVRHYQALGHEECPDGYPSPAMCPACSKGRRFRIDAPNDTSAIDQEDTDHA